MDSPKQLSDLQVHMVVFLVNLQLGYISSGIAVIEP